MRGLVIVLGLSLSLCAIVPCSADTIVANNAGATVATAENLTAVRPTEIVGAFNGDLNDVSIFEIVNRDPVNFSAMTISAGAFGVNDTVLTLFDSNGVGIYLNDDISGGDTFSCLPSSGAGNPCPTAGVTLPLGIYYLAISQSENYPLDDMGNEIFAPQLSTDLAQPLSLNPMAGWDGNSFASPDTDLVNYDIILTGTVPEPGTWLLTALGVGLIFVLARQRPLADGVASGPGSATDR